MEELSSASFFMFSAACKFSIRIIHQSECFIFYDKQTKKNNIYLKEKERKSKQSTAAVSYSTLGFWADPYKAAFNPLVPGNPNKPTLDSLIMHPMPIILH